MTGSAKFSFPIKPVSLSLQTQSAESKNLTANSATRIKTKTRKKTYKFGVTYPLASWLILAYSRKIEDQESNLDNKDYKNTWNNFTKFVLWGTVLVIVLLVILALTLL